MKILTWILVVFLMTACDEKSTGSDSCGDGVLDVGEQCDGDAFGNETCITQGYNGGTLACDDQCRLVLTACEAEGRCGDGIVQTEYDEECEAGVSTESCEELERGTGTAVCDANCRYDYSGCTASSVCGDGTIEDVEECEGSNLNDSTCITLGYYGGTLGCDDNCYFDITSCAAVGQCGDNTIQSEWSEECDGSNLQNATCASLGYYGGTLACDEDCGYDLSDCAAAGMCGDDIVQTTEGEECDGTSLQGETCESFGHDYGGTLTCDENCNYDLSGCLGWCGDGIIEGGQGETCETGNLNGASCTSLGYLQGGTLACDQCHYDVTDCIRFTEISGGNQHSCGLTSEGIAYCWGRNNYGQLGDNTTAERHVPTAVFGGHSFIHIAAGGNHTCAIATTGTTYCWGLNSSGELGDNSTTNRFQPTAVYGTNTFTQIASGASHTCALTSSGQAWCWGLNTYGALGNNSTTQREYPVAVQGGLAFARINAGGDFSCGTLANGTAYCWGHNNYGQLGDNSTTDRIVPTPVSGGLTYSIIRTAYFHTCALSLSGSAYCWGFNNAGQLGDDTILDRHVPTAVHGGLSLAGISVGYAFSCGRTAGGAAYCWGSNSSGQLGDNTTLGKHVPTAVQGGLSFSTVEAGDGDHACGVTTLGTPYCWGWNQYGQIGDNTAVTRLVPTPVTPI